MSISKFCKSKNNPDPEKNHFWERANRWTETCPYCLESRSNKSRQDNIISFQTLSEKEKERMRKRSLKDWCYHYHLKNSTLPNPIAVAGLGDRFIREARELAAYEVAASLSFEVVEKDKLTDYRRRRMPKIRVGKKVIYFRRKG